MKPKIFFFFFLFVVVAGGDKVLFAVERVEYRQIKSFNETGKQFYNNKDYTEAIGHFSKAYALNEHDGIVRGNLISAYIGQAIKDKNSGKFDEAIQRLLKALELDDSIPDTHLLLASMYLDNGDYTLAEGSLKIAEIYAPYSPAVMSMLGEVYFQQGNLEQAIRYWATSHKKEPYNETLKIKIERAQKEWNIQKNYKVAALHPFKIKYNETHAEFAQQIMVYLQEGYVNIGKIFHYFPLSDVIVIIYEPEDFQAVTSAQDSIAGLYDGKIRVKISPKLDDRQFLRKVVLHEYTHVLLRYLTNDNCPFWINEGMAQVVSGTVADISLDALNNLDLESVHFHLKNLERFNGVRKGPDFHLDMDSSVKLAYLKSFLGMSYLVNEFGIEKLLELLELLKRNVPVGEAVFKATGITVDELDTAIQAKIINAKDKMLDVIALENKALMEQKIQKQIKQAQQ